MGEFRETLDRDFRLAMERIDKELVSSIPESSPSILYKASRHLIEIGGKRIRTALLMLSHNSLSTEGDLNKILPVAIAVELIHTATIIHDDIIDRSSLRRGAQTVNAKWGDDAALITGDFIFSKAFGLISSLEEKRISESIYDACRKLAEGQILEAMHTGDTKITEEVYLEVIERKTASLFETCTRCGAILGGGNKKEVEALAGYGFLLGIGFQMTDDVLDISASELELGKPVGVDVGLGKPTFVILHALKVASERERRILQRTINHDNSSVEDIKKALEIIKGTNSIEYASKRAKSFISRAKDEIKGIKNSESKDGLLLIADYAINRDF
ncbi:MAG: polyprenyl synthetase family protein [Candidatus Hydrothermarchaeota archaeon]|nr:polyprenyl synthetase family protein [Candidatus Hydrothermarchaeota archaeon]